MASNPIDRRTFGVRLGSVLGAGLAVSCAEQALGNLDSAGGAQATNLPFRWKEEAAKDGAARLSKETHALAERALAGEHGRTMRAAAVPLPDVVGESPDMRYARALKIMAETAPLRILPGEKIVGSATLLEAVQHMTPLAGCSSTSHTTIGFHRVLESGYAGLRKRVEERLSRGGFEQPSGESFLKAMALCLDAAQIWHKRHMELLEQLQASAAGEAERANYAAVREALARVPEQQPQNFHEALQSLWFMYAFQRLAGNWSGLGRIDQMLGPYLKRDLEQGKLNLDQARELLAHFWIKGCEWNGAQGSDHGGSGDAQFYQNIILGGVDASGKEVTNEVTYLVLDVVEELHISDFPIAVRLNQNSPARLVQRIAELQRRGGGTVAIYNEEVVIDALTKFGYPLEEARGFTNDGCWEVLVPGKTAFIYIPFDALTLLHEVLGLCDPSSPAPAYPDFEALFQAYSQRVAKHIEVFHGQADGCFRGGPAAPLLSLFVDDCIERARGYHDRGAHYTVVAPHAGGLANVSNSLQVLKRLVYEEKLMSLAEFVEVLRKDWKGHEPLRRLIEKRFEFYGNDNAEADAMMQRVFNDYTGQVAQLHERNGVLRPAGISTFGREIEWAQGASPSRKASPDGHCLGDILATNFSPSPGSDRKGPTAVLRSCCKMDFTRTPNATAVELKIHPASVQGDSGRDALAALLKSFVRLHGMFLHIDVVDSAMLLDAQRHPEKYPNLAVRIAGWSARFATLNKQWQDMVIQRTQQSV